MVKQRPKILMRRKYELERLLDKKARKLTIDKELYRIGWLMADIKSREENG